MSVFLIPIVAMLIPMVIVPTAMSFKHARFLREREHAERMRALELGLTLPRYESWTPDRLALAIGVGVPVASMLIAWLATRSYNVVDSPLEMIWKSAGWVGVSGVIGGTVLATQQIMKRDRSAPAPEEKLAYDPDTFDVVGSRG
jgi:hypothetical protein